VIADLRIGIDARELLGETTGVGRYLGELLRRWTTRPDAVRRRFVLYAPELPALSFPASTVQHRIGGAGRGTWWEQTWLRRAVRADRPHVFFAPAYTAPIETSVRLVVTIHDVSFAAHPEWFRVREGARRRWLTGYAARQAAVVLTVSRFSKAEIARHLAVPEDRIRVIYEGVEPRVVPAASTIARQPLVLFAGSILNRRRLPDLLAAFARARRRVPDARLVIAGANRSWPRLDLSAVAHAHGVERDVEIRDYIPDAGLAALYARASAFAFLSEYEGFGIPPLEALAANVPSVVLDTPVAREIYGDAALYVPPDDIAATADALVALLTSRDTRAALLVHRDAVLSRYSWDAAAAATLEALERAAAARSLGPPRASV
jgi:glycosyltransferase involved in cell wall biosynthesis